MNWAEFEQSMATLKARIDSKPEDHEAAHDLAVLLGQAGHLKDALTYAQQVTGYAPDFGEGWLNLGNLEALNGNKQNAIAALRQACRCAPNDPRMWFNLGNLLAQTGQIGASIEAFETARTQAPQEPSILASLALAYRRYGRLEKAVETYKNALALHPKNTWVHSNLLVTRQYSLGETDGSLYEAHKAWGEQHGHPNTNTEDQLDRVPGAKKARLRIGYVSGDFRKHPIGYFLLGCLAHHDRGQFEITCFSDTRSRDDITTQIEDLADSWIETTDLARDAFRERVRAAEIDILVDLSGHFRHSRLPEFAQRLAPVQATWAGYVGTTGVPALDWLVADSIHAPDTYADHATERVMRLPTNYVCYTPPSALPEVTAVPSDTAEHITFGCFNNLAKINASVLEVWTNLLESVTDSVLFLKTAGLEQADIAEHVVTQMAGFGIPKARLRLEGASPHRELLEAYSRVDIALDPFPYSGGLTTLEALLMGVPVVTKTGKTFAGRHSTSHLSAVGLTDWIATNDDDYLQIAASHAQDRTALRALRSSLRPRLLASPLCDQAGFTQTLEQAFQEMWANTSHSGARGDQPGVVDIPSAL